MISLKETCYLSSSNPCPSTGPLSARSQLLHLASLSGRAAATVRTSLQSRLKSPAVSCPRQSHPCSCAFVARSSERVTAATPGADYTVSGSPEKRVLYGGHQPISPWQRVAIAGWSAVSALRDPERGDMVAALGEVTGKLALERLYRYINIQKI